MITLATVLRPLSRFALAAGIAGAVGLASPVSVSFAQSDTVTVNPNARQARHLRRGHRGGQRGLMRQLELSDAQRQQIRAIRSDAREARQNGTQMERGAVRSRVQAVLTPAQRAQAAELRQTHRAERVDRRIARMTERLSLSPAQVAQVRSILSNSASERRALAEQGDRSVNREARQALRQNTRASVRALLTPEQTAQLREGRGNRAERRQGNRAERRQGNRAERRQGRGNRRAR